MVLSITNYAYIIGTKPFPCKCQNRMEMFNETAIYLSFLFKALMQNYAIPLDLSD